MGNRGTFIPAFSGEATATPTAGTWQASIHREGSKTGKMPVKAGIGL